MSNFSQNTLPNNSHDKMYFKSPYLSLSGSIKFCIYYHFQEYH